MPDVGNTAQSTLSVATIPFMGIVEAIQVISSLDIKLLLRVGANPLAYPIGSGSKLLPIYAKKSDITDVVPSSLLLIAQAYLQLGPGESLCLKLGAFQNLGTITELDDEKEKVEDRSWELKYTEFRQEDLEDQSVPVWTIPPAHV